MDVQRFVFASQILAVREHEKFVMSMESNFASQVVQRDKQIPYVLLLWRGEGLCKMIIINSLHHFLTSEPQVPHD